MLPPPGHLLATVDQDVEIDVARRVNVVFGRLAILERNVAYYSRSRARALLD